MRFSMKDLYPNYSGAETSTMVVPEKDDQEALNQESKIAEETSQTQASTKNVLIALAIGVALVVFLGGGK